MSETMLSLTRKAVGKGEDEEVTDQVEVEGDGKGEVSFFIFLFRRLVDDFYRDLCRKRSCVGILRRSPRQVRVRKCQLLSSVIIPLIVISLV